MSAALLLAWSIAGSAPAAEADRYARRDAAREQAWSRFDEGDASAAALGFDRLWREFPGDLPALDGRIHMARAACDLEAVLRGFESDPAAAADPAVHYLAGARRQQGRRYAEAAEAYSAAAAAALAEGDSLAGCLAWRCAAACRLRFGDVGATAGAVEKARALLPADSTDRRCRLELELLSAGSFNLDSRLAHADSLYADIVVRAEAAGLNLLLCEALNGRGTIGSKQRQPNVSIPFYRRADDLAVRLGDGPLRAKILKNLGYDYTQARRVDEALAVYRQARGIVDACGLTEFLGYIHTGLGAVAEVRGDREAAIGHFTDSYLAHASAGDLRGELGARQRLAYDLMISGRYPEAAAHYGRCLEIIEARDTPYLLNWVLGGLALTHHKLGRLDEAEDYYLQAREANEALGDRMSVAWCHLSLGWLEMLRGDYRQALVRCHEAGDIYAELGDPEGIGDAHAVTAEIHYRLGDWDAAREQFEIAARIGRDEKLGGLLNRAYQGLAEVCAAAGRPGEARRYCEQALEIAREWSDANGVIWALLELAEQSLDAGGIDAARSYLARATSRLDPEAHFDFRARARLLQARCAERPREAASLAAEALELARSGGLPELEWLASSDLGEYHRAAGDMVSARRAQDEAIEVVESLRRAVGADELRRHMMRPALLPYERRVELCLAGSPADSAPAPAAVLEALAFTERSRAQILAARLQSAGAAGPRGGELRAGERELEQLAAIAYLQAQLQRSDLAPEDRSRLREEVARAEEEIRYLRLEAGANEGVVPDASADGSDLLRVLEPREEALSYFLGRDESFLFHVRRGGVRVIRLPARQVIEDRVRRYLALRSGRDVPPQILAAAERRLFELLLAPAYGELDPHAALVLVPAGILHRLPFAALRGPGGRVVEQHQIYVVPSLRSLAALRRRAAERRAADPPDLPIVAVGCGEADRGGGDTARRVHPFDDSPVSALLGARSEARQVAGLFDRAVVLTGTAASEAGFKSAPLDRAEVLHIAAHSYADEREPRRSYVLMNSSRQSAPEGSFPEDDLLQWSEAAALRLSASLVTLASCRSAGGELSVGEGVTGLTQAFLFAGGTCVLAAQGDIGDEYSRRFMLSFYEHLRRGETAAQALRRVQLDLVALEPASSRRTDWADFVLIGDGTVRLSSAPRGGATPLELSLVLTAVALCVALPVFSLVRRRRAG